MRFTVYSLDEWGRTLHASVIECDSAEDAKRMGLGTTAPACPESADRGQN